MPATAKKKSARTTVARGTTASRTAKAAKAIKISRTAKAIKAVKAAAVRSVKKTSKAAPVAKTKTTVKAATTAKVATTAKATPKVTVKTTAPVRPAAKKSVRKAASSGKRKASGDESIFGIEPYNLGKREKYMGPKQREHFRSILQAWKGQLYDEVSRTVHHMQDKPENFPDPSDRASQETDITLELRNRDRERKLLHKIEISIEQLDGEEYGYCSKCGVEIGIRRLEVRPTATLCVDCKSLDEIRERQIA